MRSPLERKSDIVLFVANEASNDQTFYLTSANGRLRRSVSVKNGVGSVMKVSEADKKAFEKEKQFWLTHLSPSPARK